MEEQKIKNLIKVWHEKARLEQDSFSKFIFLWICFNAWLNYRSNKFLDSEMIKWIIKQNSSTSDLILHYENAKKTTPFKINLKNLSSMSPILDPRGKYPPVRIKDENDFENIIKGIYMIRCNLFHGRKEANNLRDKKLIDISRKILEKWIGNLITSWE